MPKRNPISALFIVLIILLFDRNKWFSGEYRRWRSACLRTRVCTHLRGHFFFMHWGIPVLWALVKQIKATVLINLKKQLPALKNHVSGASAEPREEPPFKSPHQGQETREVPGATCVQPNVRTTNHCSCCWFFRWVRVASSIGQKELRSRARRSSVRSISEKKKCKPVSREF